MSHSGETLEEKVFTALTSNAPLAAIVGTRVYPEVLPQNEPLPALVYTVISDVPESSLNGAASSALQSARVQVDAYATTRKQSRQVDELVKAAMDLNTAKSGGFDCWPEAARNLFDEKTRHFRTSRDFNVWR